MVQANATKLRAVRLRRHLTQEALEATSGVPQTVISKLESRGPTVGVLHALDLAKALGVSVEELFGDDARQRHASTPVRGRRREPRDPTAGRRDSAA
jgi:transcriptional regulator with XRE-family HTH domain